MQNEQMIKLQNEISEAEKAVLEASNQLLENPNLQDSAEFQQEQEYNKGFLAGLELCLRIYTNSNT